ncbi:hypothetical protein [Pontimonas sp.]|uniref:hypothetical protein n=1 Tax=Pontimonas sp. TaxID=2304492 RepID=UPI0028707034|nr:hypothetical protein [Pontimonas sp.]MDR9396695.1 hypothetical protein [Pontimonas sp.]MDR9434935.1 hypothetical protein [Pontimonas sp.]
MTRKKPALARSPRGRARRPGRSLAVGPLLAPRRRRSDAFIDIVEAMMDHLKKVAPEQLQETILVIHAMPDQPSTLPGVARWRVDKAANTVHLFRLPIERLGHHHPEDRWFERMVVESVVIRAVAELTGMDPWQLAPGRGS